MPLPHAMARYRRPSTWDCHGPGLAHIGGRVEWRAEPGGLVLKRILDLIGMSVGGWLGWTLGAAVSFFTGFVVSMVGTGLGLYAMRRFTDGLP